MIKHLAIVFLFAAHPLQAKTLIYPSASGFLYLPCSIDGSHGTCLLDTGSAESWVHRKAAKGFPRGFSLQFGVSGGWPSVLPKYTVLEFTVIDVHLGAQKMVGVKEFPFPEQPKDLIGVIGMKALAGKSLLLNPRDRFAAFVSSTPGVCAPYELVAGSPYLDVKGPGGKTLHALVDSGAGISVLNKRHAGIVKFDPGNGNMADSNLQTVAVRIGRLPIQVLGAQESIRILVPESSLFPDVVADRPVDMILGLSYLSGKTFTFDQQGQQFCVGTRPN